MGTETAIILSTFFLFAAFIFLLVRYSLTVMKKRSEAWVQMGKRLDLSAQEYTRTFWYRWRFPDLRGTFRGRRLHGQHQYEQYGKHRYYYLIWELYEGNPWRQEMQLYPQNFFHEVGKMFGTQDVQIGSGDFDNRFMIKADDEALARRAWSNPGLRRRLMDLQKAMGKIILHAQSDGTLYFRVSLSGFQIMSIIEHMEQAAHLLSDLADEWKRQER